jgi:hypothetical protein
MKPTITLQREIGRLYSLGQTPHPYASNNASETLMNLYLPYKHGLKDTHYQDICKDYAKYDRLTVRQRKICKPPVHYIDELCVYFDKNEKWLSDNRDEYYSRFYWRFRNLIESNPHKKVACVFNIAIIGSESSNGHVEIVVFDPALNVIEHVDSNHLPKQCMRKERAYMECCRLSQTIVRNVAAVLPTEPIYISTHDIYSGYDWGIQSLEAASDQLTEPEKGGYCLMWAHLLGDLALMFPDDSIKHIIETMLKKSDSKNTKVLFKNDYLLYVIRGYVADISKTFGCNFENDDSKHNTCIQFSKKMNL